MSYSRTAQVCVAAAETLATDGITCDVIDLRTIAPLDVTAVLESVARTNRLLIAHEATSDFGVGAEIAARIADEGICTSTHRSPESHHPACAPYSPVLEAQGLPDQDRIITAAQKLLAV